MRLAGKRALVTGGAGGAGAASARRFLDEGASVAVLDLHDRELPDGATFHCVDVSDAVQVQAAVRAIGDVDVLFNHAGTFLVKPLVDMSEAEWDRLMAINVKSMFLMCRAVLPGMVARGGGVILNTSSVSGLTANALESAYCATKGAVLQLTRAIAIEYRGHGIRCNALCPGFIRSAHGDRERAELAACGEVVDDAEIARVQGRVCEPEDVAAAALALVTDDARFVNGAYLTVDNGWMAMT